MPQSQTNQQFPWLPAQQGSQYGRLPAYWLTRPGALTAGLRKLGHLTLSVLKEYQEQLSPTEAWQLELPAQQPTSIWVREIYMCIDATPMVVARSFTTTEAAQGPWQGIRGLGQRPLADMLYHDPDIRRGPFWVCHLTPEQPLYATLHQRFGPQTDTLLGDEPLYARCSTFWHQGQPLLVSECFLPEFWPLAQKYAAANSSPP